MMLAALPLPWGMTLAFAAGLAAGAYVNWATYMLAWNRRLISPWGRAAAEAPARRPSDRLPLWGWLGLRRERSLHGSHFWVRPMIVELALAFGFAALYWWEVGRQGLVAAQFEAVAGPQAVGLLAAPTWTTLATFASHALLATLMAAASMIDIDEKTIPDGITVPGTLLGLIFAAVLPMSLLPHVALRSLPPPAGVMIPWPPMPDAPPVKLYVEPLSLTAPNEWAAALNGAPQWASLALGLACYIVWCLALTPRVWRRRRGLCYGLSVLAARVSRELARPPLAWIGMLGIAGIVGVWWRGGAAWVGLLTALVGVVGGGAMIWGTRVVAKGALRKEAMGFGDVTLMMMIGAFLGWQSSIFIFFIAPCAALVIGIVRMVLHHDDEIPYGPFLCLGTLVVMERWADFWNADPLSLQAYFDFGWLVPVVLAIGLVFLGAMLVIWRNIKEALFQAAE